MQQKGPNVTYADLCKFAIFVACATFACSLPIWLIYLIFLCNFCTFDMAHIKRTGKGTKRDFNFENLGL